MAQPQRMWRHTPVSLKPFGAVSNGSEQLSPDLSCSKLPLGW